MTLLAVHTTRREGLLFISKTQHTPPPPPPTLASNQQQQPKNLLLLNCAATSDKEMSRQSFLGTMYQPAETHLALCALQECCAIDILPYITEFSTSFVTSFTLLHQLVGEEIPLLHFLPGTTRHPSPPSMNVATNDRPVGNTRSSSVQLLRSAKETDYN